MAGLEPNVAACEATRNESAQRATCRWPQILSVDVGAWLGAWRGHLRGHKQCERPEGDLQGATEVFQWTLMAGLKLDVVTYEAMSNASAQRATCKGPQKSFSERCWLP